MTQSAPDFSRAIAQAMSDRDYRHRLLSDPHSALSEAGIGVPEGVSVRVVENAPNSIHLTLPQRPPAASVHEEDLNRMASGGVRGFSVDFTDLRAQWAPLHRATERRRERGYW